MKKKFNIGIPVYVCPEKALLLLDDINKSTVTPHKVMICDNSRKFHPDETKYRFPIELHRPHYNIGCAPAWNLLLRNGLPTDTIIFNEDIRLVPTALEEWINRPEGIVMSYGYCAFLMRNHVYEEMGLFDENIWPVYFEDSEYNTRLSQTPHTNYGAFNNRAWVQHTGGTVNVPEGRYTNSEPLNSRVRAYVEEKWGGPIDHPTFKKPWNNKPFDIMDWSYEWCCKRPADINEHLPKLKELAAQCESVAEFGTRTAVSTIGLMAGRPSYLTTYDTHYHPAADVIYNLAHYTTVKRVVQDVLTMPVIEPVDMLFIDTRHTYEQIKVELSRHGNQARKFLAFHDTSLYGEKGEDGNAPGLLAGIKEFLAANPRWKQVYQVDFNCGLTVLERKA